MVVEVETAGAISTRPEHRAAMGRIYEEAFPPSERDEFEATQRDGRLALQVVALADDQLVGFAQTIDIPGTDWCLLEYMAVERHQRSKGVG